MLKLKVLAVCGFGVGSSMLLKMKVDEMLKNHKIQGSVETTDIGSASSIPCNVIFTSNELAGKIKEKVSVPVIGINNFLDIKEIEDKGLPVLEKLS